MGCLPVESVEYMTRLSLTPVHKDYKAKHLNKNTDKMVLTEDFMIRVNGEIIITVPENYCTDGASIPSIFHGFYHPFSTESFWGAVVHDYLYSHLYYKFPKEFADSLLKKMIQQDGGSWFMQNAFYNAVKLNITGGGW